MSNTKKICIGAALVAAAVGCKSGAEHLTDLVDKLAEKCYEAKKITFKEHTNGGVAFTLPNGEVKILTGSEQTIDGLTKKDKNNDAVAPALRPIVAVAVDPAYVGSDSFSLGSFGFESDGATLPMGADAAAMAALSAQVGSLNWKMIATQAFIDPAYGTSVSLTMDLSFEMQTKLVAGSKSAPKIPVVYAVRWADGEAFEVFRDTAEHEHGIFSSVEPILDGADLTGGQLSVVRGQSLALTSVRVWNNRSSSFTGSVDFSVERETGSSGVIASIPVGSLAAYKDVNVPAVVVPTSSLLQGDHVLVMNVMESGSVIKTTRVPLNVTGPGYQVPVVNFGDQISATSGGSMEMWINGGSVDASASYIMLASVTPGLGATALGIDFPIIFDSLTSSALSWLGTPILPTGAGVLDANGFASVDFNLPPLPGVYGFDLFFAPYVDNTAAGFAAGTGTRAIAVTLVP